MSERIAWYVYPLLLFPKRIARNLERVRAGNVVEQAPNLWQLSLGVLRMYHRLVFHTDTVGTCQDHPVRRTWRARLLQFRGFRLPALLAEGAVLPMDLTGLASTPEELIRHLLGAHHDGNQFVYDLELLALHPGRLDELEQAAREVVEGTSQRAPWLRDLTVFEQYHENLLAAVERVRREGITLDDDERHDPNLSLRGFLDWCASQPASPAETWSLLRRRSQPCPA